jgi:tetratricopeptide (TPR) repeat protein
MSSKYSKLAIFIAVVLTGIASAQDFSSPLAAEAVYQSGCRLVASPDADLAQAKKAMILFNASLTLDRRADYVPPEIIKLAWRYPQGDFSEIVKVALDKYLGLGRSADIDVALKAVKYLNEKLATREERQKFLLELMDKYGKTNQFFASELATQLGFLSAETADTASAQQYFMYAFSANNYNRLAFNTLVETSSESKQGISYAAYLQSLRLAVRVNPLDIESAYNFAKLSESAGLYASAAAGYRYCIQVNNYLNPSSGYSPEYYRPWALNCMNTRNYRLCNTVLQKVRAFGVYDVMVEAVAAMSAKQGGDVKESQAILNGINAAAAGVLSGKTKPTVSQLQDYAWFYAFVQDSNSDALAWATKAYDADNDSASAQAFLAYALVLNGQKDLAIPMLQKIGTSSQTAAIAQAMVFKADGKDSNAVELLKLAVQSSPGTFEAVKAKDLLKGLGSEYVSPLDSAALETVILNEYGQSVFSEFMPPDKMITAALKTAGSAFSYGTPLDLQLSIVNNFTEPMIVGPDSIFKGNVRVDVRVSGDLSEKFENYIVRTVRPSYEIKPGSALFVPLKLSEGQLGNLLDGHPQADLNLEIKVYLDPQENDGGSVVSLLGAEPIKVIVKRRSLALDTLYLQQRFDALKSGKQGQKIKSVQLFAGLLAEQQRLAGMKNRYKFLYCEPGLLTSAMAKCLLEDDWVLKVHTMAALQDVNLDYRLIDAISAQLDYKDWPVRLISVFTLAEKQGGGFQEVVKWVNSNDSSPLVKDMTAELMADK